MRKFLIIQSCCMSFELMVTCSIEHNDVEIVAVNDPFIEPHYAVSTLHLSHISRSCWKTAPTGVSARRDTG
jgi:hypothetical protein